MDDPTDLTLETAAREDAAKKAALAKQVAIGDLKWVMSNKRGRRFVRVLLEQCGIFKLSYTPGDALQTAFNEGQRNVGNRVFAELNEHAPECYAQMLSEHHVRND